MSEPKVLHEFTGHVGNLEIDFRVSDGVGCLRVEMLDKTGWNSLGDTAQKVWACREIIRLSAELARARAEGRLEGRRDTLDEAINAIDQVTGGLDIDWDEAAQRVAQSSRRALLRLRAAAERELAGEEEA